jgi:hypothetical protein
MKNRAFDKFLDFLGILKDHRFFPLRPVTLGGAPPLLLFTPNLAEGK